MSVCKNAVVVKLFALLLVAVAMPATARGQNHRDHDVDVEVVNTPNVKVVNTPSVNVNQLPAVQLAPGTAVTVNGSPTVQVGNPVQLAPGTAVAVSGTPTVQVGNTAANPVPVHDPATPKRTPFQNAFEITMKDGASPGEADLIVPDGKRLVIEYASVYGGARAPLFYTILMIASSGAVFRYYLPVIQVADSFNGNKVWIASQMVKLFADPGTDLILQCSRFDSTGDAGATFTLSGYLEDVQ